MFLKPLLQGNVANKYKILNFPINSNNPPEICTQSSSIAVSIENLSHKTFNSQENRFQADAVEFATNFKLSAKHEFSIFNATCNFPGQFSFN